MPHLFEQLSTIPLAERLRPQNLDQIVGQDHLLTGDGFLGCYIAQKHLPSLIFWGSPGVGKTTLARLLAAEMTMEFVALSAVDAGIKDMRRIFDQARIRSQDGRSTVLFVDEIHRFNRTQQDHFLPYIERGDIILLGATTENPSFALIPALLSRCQVVILRRLDEASLSCLAKRAEKKYGRSLSLDDDARQALYRFADGDGRRLLNCIEALWSVSSQTKSQTEPMTTEAMANVLQASVPRYDANRDAHYNIISALHKSIRASHVDAALYWLARMVEAGEDEDYILRRLIRIANEDIGLSDPNAILQATSAALAWRHLGAPEGHLAIAQVVIYLSMTTKSNAAYRAWQGAVRAAADHGSLPPPKHLLNAPTSLMEATGYGDGYAYDHDLEGAFSGQECFPNKMVPVDFYHPVGRGLEKDWGQRLKDWRDQRRASAAQTTKSTPKPKP